MLYSEDIFCGEALHDHDWHVEIDLYTFEVSELVECICDRANELSSQDLNALRNL